MPYGYSFRINVCMVLAAIISVMVGVAVGILYAYLLIPGIEVFAWIAFGLGVLTLVLLFVFAALASLNPQTTLSRCANGEAGSLAIAVIGTIVLAIVMLSIALLPPTIILDIIVGFGAFFFSLMVFGWAILLKCITRCIRIREE